MKYPCSLSRFLCTFICFLLFSSSTHAQSNSGRYWDNAIPTSDKLSKREQALPTRYHSFTIDLNTIKQLLTSAPAEQVGSQRSMLAGLRLELPLPDGTSAVFSIVQTSVMAEPMASTYPYIKTFIATQIDNPAIIARLDHTLLGFHAMIMDPSGWSFIEPLSIGNTTDYISYYKRHSQSRTDFSCGTTSSETELERSINNSGNNTNKSIGDTLRNYRLALSCTGEYAAVFGGTKAGALSAMVTSVNRVSGVYEKELSVRLTLIGNDSLIIYTNSATDPFTNGNGSTMLGENQTTCTSVIGSANYDIGHVFSTGGGGVANLYVPCVSSSKARGVTGSGSPFGDGYDIDYVAHEIGHQFGGNHTFHSVTGNCSGGNRNASTAYEVGSGVTIMAYAGICGTDDLAPNSIAYFHTKSFEEIINYITTSNGNSCPTKTLTGNLSPVVTVGSDFSIPISTPFILTGSATDGNGDALTYSWEEMDQTTTGGAYNQTQVANTDIPLFRPFEPVTTPSRTFPKISDIVTNTATIGERLPSVARLLDFRLTARDNRVGGGGVNYNDVTRKITVVAAAGPFVVTAPNTAVTWSSGTSQTITWNVANTIAAPVNTANVKISLSSDGGFTYPTVIVSTTANDGSEAITVPGVITTQARIKVEAVGNIYFDISNVNFTIHAGSSVITNISTLPLASNNICQGSAVAVTFSADGPANAGNYFTAQLSNSAGSFATPDSIGSLSSINAGTVNAVIPIAKAPGTGYRIRVISSNPAVIGSNNGSDVIIFGIPAAAGTVAGSSTVCQGQNGVAYSVPAIANATTYTWTLPTGATIASGTGTNSITVNYSASATSGVVTVTGSNAGCSGPTSPNLNVTVNPLPLAAGIISGTSSVCQNQTGVVYSVSTIAGATSYIWTVPSGASITSGSNTNSITVSFNSSAVSGNITVAGSNSCGSGIVSANFPVGISAAPAPTIISAAGSTTVCTPSTVSLSYTPAGGINYQWRKDGVNIPGATSTPYLATQTGNYDVVATSASLTAQTFTNSTAIAIPDNNCVGALSTIPVSGYTNPINTSKIYAKINVTHPWDGDVVIFLQSPTGQILGLANRVGSNGDNFTNTVFADSGAVQLPAASSNAPYTGLYKPYAPVFTSCLASNVVTFAAIGGGSLNPNGNWILSTYDRASADSGTVLNWSITFPGEPLSCSTPSNAIGVTVNAAPAIASFTPSSGAVGTGITINGSNFTGASSVHFNNNINASFSVINSGQISATVPSGSITGLISVITPCGTANSGTSFTVINNATLTIKVFIDGLYSSGAMTPALSNSGVTGNTTVSDTIRLVLHQASTPYVIDTIIAQPIATNGYVTFILPGNRVGNSYYIALVHRNSIETWSKLPVTLGINTSFDFTQ